MTWWMNDLMNEWMVMQNSTRVKPAVHKPIVLPVNVSVNVDTSAMDTPALVSHISLTKYAKCSRANIWSDTYLYCAILLRSSI